MSCDKDGGAGFLLVSMMLLRFPYYTRSGMSPEALVWSDVQFTDWCYKEAGLRGGLLATGARSEDTARHQSFLLSSSAFQPQKRGLSTPQASAAMLPFSTGSTPGPTRLWTETSYSLLIRSGMCWVG